MRYKNIIFVVLTLWIARVSFSQTISIGVDASAGKTAISPYIFGANVSLSEDSTNPTPASTWQMYRDVGLNMFRDCGGNNATKYNWRLKLTCHPDWYKNVYGENWDYPSKCLEDNLPSAKSMYAFQLIGYAASNTNNNFNDWTYNQSQWWCGVEQCLAGGGIINTTGTNCSQALKNGNPNLYLEKWTADSTVGILDQWFGTGGLNHSKNTNIYWSMDNEPEIWNGTHDDVMPAELSADSFMRIYFKVAKAARAKFPGIKLLGPVPANEWQWYNWTGGSGGLCWLEYFIKTISKMQDTSGIRLLDVLDIHFYPGATSNTDIGNLYKVFYDTTYIFPEANGVKNVSGNWDNSQNKEYIFSRCNTWLTKYMGANHGVTLSMSETGINGSNTNVTAVWYASTLGTFADHGVEVFTPWSWKVGMWETMHLFSRYGKEFRVQSSSSLEDSVSAYSSVNTNIDSMTILLVNRSISNAQKVSVKISNFPGYENGGYNTLALYNLPETETFISQTNNALKSGSVNVVDSVFTSTLQPLSITAVILSKNAQSLTSTNHIEASGSDAFNVYYVNGKPEIVLSYNIANDSQVKIDLFDIQGRLINHIENTYKQHGGYNITFNHSALHNGIYIIMFNAGQTTEHKKVILSD